MMKNISHLCCNPDMYQQSPWFALYIAYPQPQKPMVVTDINQQLNWDLAIFFDAELS